MQQLELFVSPAPPVDTGGKTPEQEAAFQLVLADCRRESAEIDAFAKKFSPDLVDWKSAPIEEYKTICTAWHRSKGRLPAQVVERQSREGKPLPPLRQWSTEAKQKHRLKKLHERLQRQFSFPELLHEALQDLVLKNPAYYGICPLPSEGRSAYYPPNLQQIAAIKLENECRAKGV